MKKKKILVLGATGHLGAYTVDYLKDALNFEEYELIAVGRKETDFFAKQNIKYLQLDITQKSDFDNLPKENVHAVICLIGAMPASIKGYNPYAYIDVNVTGMLNVLEYCRENKVDRIIFTQTESDLSGNWGENVVVKPDMPRNYSLKGNYALYVLSKCTAMDLIEVYYQNFGLKRFIFRLPTVYHYRPDPYFYKNGEKKLLGYRKLINQAMAGEDIELWGNPLLGKDIVYVKDFTQMIYKAIISSVEGGVYNVGTGIATSLEDIIKGIIEVFSTGDKKSKIIYCPEKEDTRSFVMDIENAKEELGYEPQYDYISYLKDFKKEMELNRFDELWEYKD